MLLQLYNYIINMIKDSQWSVSGLDLMGRLQLIKFRLMVSITSGHLLVVRSLIIDK